MAIFIIPLFSFLYTYCSIATDFWMMVAACLISFSVVLRPSVTRTWAALSAFPPCSAIIVGDGCISPDLQAEPLETNNSF